VRNERRGFSLLELVVVIVIVSVLAVFAIDRLLALRFEAERVGVQSVLSALRSGLYIEFAGQAVRGQLGRAAAAEGSNPMLTLSEKPESYAGEFHGADPALFAPGTWYYDSRDGVLVYLVRFPEQFASPLGPPARMRYKVVPDYDNNQVRGLKLVPLEAFSWKGTS
jgi:prepilin-type N-terminal cleavage/methylation domain-containing protein